MISILFKNVWSLEGKPIVLFMSISTLKHLNEFNNATKSKKTRNKILGRENILA